MRADTFKTRVLSFVDALREAGLRITLAETLDAAAAVRVSGIERSVFRESLAATLVKDEADRPAFDAVFERFFAGPKRGRSASPPPPTPAEGEGHGPGQFGDRRRPETPPDDRHPVPGSRAVPERPSERPHQQQRQGEEPARRLARDRALQNTSFHDMSPRDAEECPALVARLAQRFRAHLRRRQRDTDRGRVDLRRTLRRSTQTGGVPMQLAFRRRRPGRPDLVVLCDYSYSVVTASSFLLALIIPARDFFRRVRLFAFIDRPVEVSVESGVLVPHDRLDLYARSDFGHVLVTFWEQYESLLTRSTIVLVLGDARNNRHPPRADILARVRSGVRRVVWLNPEPRSRWNTGDSVIRSYERHCDTILCASNVRELHAAVRTALRTA